MNSSTNNQAAAPPRLLRIKQVQQLTGLGRTKTYALIEKGKHPAQIKVGRRSVWLESEISDWIERLALQRAL